MRGFHGRDTTGIGRKRLALNALAFLGERRLGGFASIWEGDLGDFGSWSGA